MIQTIHKHWLRLVLCLVGSAFVLSAVLTPNHAQALSGSEFEAGRIIDDGIFTDANSMSISEIQAFLEQAVDGGECDRYRSSSNPKYQPPWTCVYEFEQNPTTYENNYGKFTATGQPASVPGGLSSAEIIWQAGQKYDINPQVLIVLLQKEQSLITDNWPWPTQYSSATGYYCPDTAPCDPSKANFYIQVDGAARLFRYYLDNLDEYWYHIGVNDILYHPNSSCGRKTINIQNAATVALYLYTPYTPNQAALNNLYGTGDSCSSYGNRNFWRLFNDWFGSTQLTNPVVEDELTLSDYSPQVGKPIEASFTLTNISSTDIHMKSVKVVAEQAGQVVTNFPGNWNVTIAPGETYTYSESSALPKTGAYRARIAIKKNGVWNNTYGYVESAVRVERAFRVHVAPEATSSLDIPSGVPQYSSIDASVSLKNYSPQTVTLDRVKVVAKSSANEQVLFDDSNVSLASNSTKPINIQSSLDAPGKYTVALVAMVNGKWMDPAWFGDTGKNTSTSTNVGADVKASGALGVSSRIARNDDTVTATITLANSGSQPATLDRLKVLTRDSRDQKHAFATVSNVVIPAGGTYSYSKSRKLSRQDIHVALASFRTASGVWHEQVFGGTKKIRVDNEIVIHPGLRTTGAKQVEESITASFSLTNMSDEAVVLQRLKVGVRDEDGNTVSYSGRSNLSLAPGETYEYVDSRAFSQPGRKQLFVAVKRDGIWLKDIIVDGLSTSSPLERVVAISPQ